MIDAIAKEISAITAAAGGDTFGKHLQDGIEIRAGQIAIGIRVANQIEEIVLAPLLRGASGHDLLRQNVEWIREHQSVQIARAQARTKAAHSSKLVEGGGEDTALRNRSTPMAGAANPLQSHGNGTGRADLTDRDPQSRYRCPIPAKR